MIFKIKHSKYLLFLNAWVLLLVTTPQADAHQLHPFEAKVTVDFDNKLRDWNGFGLNKAGGYTFENGTLTIDVRQKLITTCLERNSK